MPSPEEIIRAYAQVARPILLDFMPRRSCIAAAHVGVTTLGLFEVTVEPVAVDFRLVIPDLNAAYVSGMSEESRVTAQAEASAFIDLDTGSGWNGHVVLIWDSQLLIDPSFDQAFASMAESGIEGVPTTPLTLVLPLEGHGFGAETMAHYSMRMDPPADHRFEVYYGGKDDNSYRETDAWRDEALPLIVSVIARAMLKQLQSM